MLGFFVMVQAGRLGLLLMLMLMLFPVDAHTCNTSRYIVLCAPCAGVTIPPKRSVGCDISIVGGYSRIGGTSVSILKVPQN